MTRTLIHERGAAPRRGENPTVIRRMPSGWAVLGDRQLFPGYSMSRADPVAPDLNALRHGGRGVWLNARHAGLGYDRETFGEKVRLL